jgi:NurA-like 5'-3' nuclease
MDGTLEATCPFEKEIIDSINTPFFGLSKTTALLTQKGNTAVAVLKNSANRDMWAYYLGKANEKNHNAYIYFLKLNVKSDYVLRFEAANNKYGKEVISLLSENSRDPIFPGYPYGLIDADRYARVSKKEKEALRLQLMVLLGKEGNKVKPYLNAMNAHDILDNIS